MLLTGRSATLDPWWNSVTGNWFWAVRTVVQSWHPSITARGAHPCSRIQPTRWRSLKLGAHPMHALRISTQHNTAVAPFFRRLGGIPIPTVSFGRNSGTSRWPDLDVMAPDDDSTAWRRACRSPPNGSFEGPLPPGKLWWFPRIDAEELVVYRRMRARQDC